MPQYPYPPNIIHSVLHKHTLFSPVYSNPVSSLLAEKRGGLITPPTTTEPKDSNKEDKDTAKTLAKRLGKALAQNSPFLHTQIEKPCPCKNERECQLYEEESSEDENTSLDTEDYYNHLETFNENREFVAL